MLAYLDAGTGSLLLQIIVGGAAGVIGYVKYRASGFRRNSQPEETIEPTAEPAGEDASENESADADSDDVTVP